MQMCKQPPNFVIKNLFWNLRSIVSLQQINNMVITNLESKNNKKFYLPVNPIFHQGKTNFNWQSIRSRILKHTANLSLRRGRYFNPYVQQQQQAQKKKTKRPKNLVAAQEQALRIDMLRMSAALENQEVTQNRFDECLNQQQMKELQKKISIKQRFESLSQKKQSAVHESPIQSEQNIANQTTIQFINQPQPINTSPIKQSGGGTESTVQIILWTNRQYQPEQSQSSWRKQNSRKQSSHHRKQRRDHRKQSRDRRRYRQVSDQSGYQEYQYERSRNKKYRRGRSSSYLQSPPYEEQQSRQWKRCGG